jgi:hypothetical protein
MQMVNVNQLATEEGKNFVKKVLQEGVVNITFTKVDGRERNMKCTLSSKIVPAAPEKKTERTRPENQNVLSVWDTENNGWRSFRWDSIKNFSFEV